MASKWEVKRLGDVINLKRGYDLPASKRIDGEVPIMASSGITGYHNEAKIQGPGVVTGRSGQLGKVFYIDEDYWALNTTLYVENFKGNYPKYIYYLLQTLNFEQFNAGSSVPTLNRNHVHQIEVKIPPYNVQKRIGDLIYQFEEKVTINNNLINKMEEISKLLFKKWFIDFEFLNEHGLPYRSTGGEMVESELGEVPKGWRLVALYDLANYINGTSFKKQEIDENQGVPIIKIAELKNGITNTTKYFNGSKPEKFNIENEDILFSWSGNPQTSIDTFIWYRGKGILNQHIFKVVPNNYEKTFIYLILKYFKPTFTEIASNKQTTGLGHVTVNDLKRIKIALPNDKVIAEFTEIVRGLVKNIFLKYVENNHLETLKETLLPTLLSGKIEIPEESVVEPS